MKDKHKQIENELQAQLNAKNSVLQDQETKIKDLIGEVNGMSEKYNQKLEGNVQFYILLRIAEMAVEASRKQEEWTNKFETFKREYDAARKQQATNSTPDGSTNIQPDLEIACSEVKQPEITSGSV